MGQNMDMTLNAPLLSFVQLLANLSIDFNAQQFQGFFLIQIAAQSLYFQAKLAKST